MKYKLKTFYEMPLDWDKDEFKMYEGQNLTKTYFAVAAGEYTQVEAQFYATANAKEGLFILGDNNVMHYILPKQILCVQLIPIEKGNENNLEETKGDEL